MQNSCHMCDICDFKYLSCDLQSHKFLIILERLMWCLLCTDYYPFECTLRVFERAKRLILVPQYFLPFFSLSFWSDLSHFVPKYRYIYSKYNPHHPKLWNFFVKDLWCYCTLQKKEVYAWWIEQGKHFKISHIFRMRILV